MNYKSLTLLLVIYLLTNYTAFSQDYKAPDNTEIINQYNSWLTLSGLNRLMQVVEIKDSTNAPARKKTIILKPIGNYHDPQKFAKAWLNVKGTYQKNDIDFYLLLLSKLSDYAFLSPGEVAIEIKTADSVMFDLRIIYQDKLRYNESIGTDRGTDGVESIALNVDFDQDYCFESNGPKNPKAILQALDTYFKKYNSGNEGIKVDSIVNTHNSGVKYRVAHVLGVVTQTRLHELITLNIAIDPKGLCYQVDIQYSDGSKTPDPDSNAQFYHQAGLKFPQQCKTYRRLLLSDLKSLLHGK